MATTNDLPSGLVLNKRFESVVEVPPNELDLTRPYVPYRIYKELKGARPIRRKWTAAEVAAKVAEHKEIARSIDLEMKKKAKSQAWFATKKLRREMLASFRKPGEFSGDEFLPEMVEPRVSTIDSPTYADVAAEPVPDHVDRVKPVFEPKCWCDCAVCTFDRRRRAQVVRAIQNRKETKALKAIIKRSNLAFERHMRRLARAPQVCSSTMEQFFSENKFSPLSTDESDWETEEEVEEPDDYSTPIRERRPKKKVVVDDWETLIPMMDQVRVEEEPTHDPRRVRVLKGLLRRAIEAARNTASSVVRRARRARVDELKAYIRAFVSGAQSGEMIEMGEIPSREYFKKLPVYESTTSTPLRPFRVEMDGDDKCPVREDQASNVVLQEAANIETECVPSTMTGLRKYCVGETTVNSANLDRWTQISNFTWSTTNSYNDTVISSRLPFDAIYQKKDPTSEYKLRDNVIANEFRLRQYFDCDMVVRIQLNSTPFHIGQLQVGWYYLYEQDANSSRRDHVVCLSQTNHVIIDAANSNSAEICIPHRNYRSYINTYNRTDLGPYSYMGTLLIKVLSPLKVATGSAKDVDGMIQIRLSRCELAGMIPPNLVPSVKTQMFSAVMALEAAKYVRQFLPDRNRDKPPNPHSASHMYPQTTSSLASGTNDVEPVTPLRLDPLGQTPHPDPSDSSFSVKEICSIFSFVKAISISATMAHGTQVECFEASPIFSFSQYSKTAIDGTDCFYLPPIAVISQLYAYWRGDIQFRLDFVASRFHTMRLWICWVPGYLGTITFEQSLSCAGTYFDLSCDNRSVTIDVPFISDKPWWNHRFSNGVRAEEYDAPSKVCIFVANRLTYTNAIPSSIEALLYVRGGSNFEVSVPCQPSIGLCFKPGFVDESDDFTMAYDGYFPWYVGSWRNFEGGKKAILRYGPGSDHVAQFINLKQKTFYKVKDPEVAKTLVFNTASVQTNLSECVLVPVKVSTDTLGYRYLAVIYVGSDNPVANTSVKDWFLEKKGNKWTWRTTPNYDVASTIGDESFSIYTKGNITLVENELALPLAEESSDSDSSFETLQTEGDTRNEVTEKVTFEYSPSSSAGMECFGESHMDLKDICRRYQFYHQVDLSTLTPDFATVDYSFPLLPQGLDLQPISSPYQSLVRDGIIPICLSGYRFYRGGLRFKILVNMPSPATFTVQIRPDRKFAGAIPRAGGRTKMDGVYLHGYASAVQAVGVNPVLTLEVPFYIPGNCGLLQRPSDSVIKNAQMSRFVSLGELCLSVNFPAKIPTGVIPGALVMYSLADDFSPSLFQGFPPMCFVRDSKKD